MKKKKLTSIAASAVLLETIIASHQNSVFAECSDDGSGNFYVCTDAENICIAESTTHDFNVDINGFRSDYPNEVSISEVGGSILTIPFPTMCLNSWCGSPQGVPTTLSFLDIPFTLTTDPVDASDSYLGVNGRLGTTVRISSSTDYYYGSPWGWSNYPTSVSADRTVVVDHINEAPVLSDLLPDEYTNTFASGVTSQDLSVTVDIADAESNSVEVLFELSDNPGFTNILQSQTYTVNAIPTGIIQGHTFTNLAEGSYNWRVSAVETNAQALCVGYPNADPPINLSSNIPNNTITLNGADVATVSGYVFIDNNNNNIYDEGDVPLPNITVFIEDSNGTQTVVTDSLGQYQSTVEPGNVTIEVDSSDPDLPVNYDVPAPHTVIASIGTDTNSDIPLITELASTGNTFFIPSIIAMLLMGSLLVKSFQGMINTQK
jgi:hypothetical protein